MAGWLALADNVPGSHYKWAWVTVIGLYVVPTLFFAYRSWTILHDGLPALQTSESKLQTWGTLPLLTLCSGNKNHVKVAACYLHGFVNVTDPKFREHLSKKKTTCTMSGYSNEKMNSLTRIIELSHAPPYYGQCTIIDATALQAQAPQAPAPSIVSIHAYVTNKTREPLFLLSGAPLRVLTGISPGLTVLKLKKKARGTKRFTGNPDFKDISWSSPSVYLNASLYWNALALMFMPPKLTDVYTTQVEYQYLDDELEDPFGGLFNDKKNMSKNLQNLLASAKYQLYKFQLNIDQQYVMEEVEIGRYPQLAWLLSGIGGYMSVISCILGVCWVQRFPKSQEVMVCDAKTFVLAPVEEDPMKRPTKILAAQPAD